MNINLREEKVTEYILFYQNYLEDIQQMNQRVTGVLNEIMQQSRYDKLQQQISRMIDAYTDIIVNSIEAGIFSAWQESGGSLRACLRTYKAGDMADGVCILIEQQMGDMMQEILKIEKADLIVTERPVVSEDGLEQLEDICKYAQTEVRNLQREYLGRIETKIDENDIYGTLMPLVQGISENMESFFEASLHSFEGLHAFVQGLSLQLHNIAEENRNVAGGTGSGGTINPGMADSLGLIANSMANNGRLQLFGEFKKMAKLLDNTIYKEHFKDNKTLTYDLISKLMPIYHRFYKNYGDLLKDGFSTQEEREEFVKREYIAVTRERKNEQYFINGKELSVFKSHAHHTYTVFDRVADMLNNIAVACQNGKANDTNLLYGAYVLFQPIIQGHIDDRDSREYSKFNNWALKEIFKLLGNRVSGNVPEKLAKEELSSEVLQLHNIAEENDNVSGGTDSRETINPSIVGRLYRMVNFMGTNGMLQFSDFRKKTKLIFNTIDEECGIDNDNKTLTYDLISKLMPIYHRFYKNYGDLLKDGFSTQEEREEFVKREYIAVTRERKNEQYFINGEELSVFKSRAHHTYAVFDRVADMLNNIAVACQNGNANDINLLYGAYVLFQPIIRGHVDNRKY